jgi:hypothetical protein
MNEAVLYALSEVAIALAGFSGVAAAFNLRGPHTWSAMEVRILWFLVLDSFFVLLFSLLPVPLYLAGWPQEMLWGVCSALLGSWFIIGNLLAFHGEQRDHALRKSVAVSRVTPILYVVLAVALVMGVALWLSAFNIIVPRGQAIYVAGLVALVAFAAVEFLFFIDMASRRKKLK